MPILKKKYSLLLLVTPYGPSTETPESGKKRGGEWKQQKQMGWKRKFIKELGVCFFLSLYHSCVGDNKLLQKKKKKTDFKEKHCIKRSHTVIFQCKHVGSVESNLEYKMRRGELEVILCISHQLYTADSYFKREIHPAVRVYVIHARKDLPTREKLTKKLNIHLTITQISFIYLDVT